MIERDGSAPRETSGFPEEPGTSRLVVPGWELAIVTNPTGIRRAFRISPDGENTLLSLYDRAEAIIGILAEQEDGAMAIRALAQALAPSERPPGRPTVAQLRERFRRINTQLRNLELPGRIVQGTQSGSGAMAALSRPDIAIPAPKEVFVDLGNYKQGTLDDQEPAGPTNPYKKSYNRRRGRRLGNFW